MARRESPRRLLIVVLSVAWVFVVYLGYYTVHKPFSASIILAILDRLIDLAIWVGLVLLATALGDRLLRRHICHSLLEQLTFSAGLGLGLISLLTLGLGMLGLLHRQLFYIILALAYLVLFPQVKSVVQRLRQLPRPHLLSPLQRFLAVFVAVVLGLSLLASLTPPTAWDSQVYHLTGPRLFIERGRIVGGIDIPYLGFPALMEMLFLLGMLLKGDIVAKLIHFGYLLLTIGLLYSFSSRFLQFRSDWLAPAIYLSVPSLVLVSTWAYVDSGLAFYSLAGFYSLVVWAHSRKRPWLILSGILCGLALGVKYTAFVTPLSLGLAVIWRSKKHSLTGIGRNLLAFGLPTLAVGCPWYLRNLVLTRNPLYPFFLGGSHWDEYRAWWYSRWGTGLTGEPLRLLLASWEMTILGTEGKEGYAATIGPFLLACLPLLFLMFLRRNRDRQTDRIIAYAILVCGVAYAFWLYGVAQSALLQQTRLLYPIFPILALLAGIAVEQLAAWDIRGFSLQRFIFTVLALTLGVTAFAFLLDFFADSPAPYVLGLETEEDYISGHLGHYYGAVDYVNKELSPSARILFLWEPRSYYCRRDCWPDAILDRFKHLTHKYGNAEGVAEYLHTQGITHVLFHEAGFQHILDAQFDPILPADIEILETLQEKYLEPLHEFGDAYVLYQVR